MTAIEDYDLIAGEVREQLEYEFDAGDFWRHQHASTCNDLLDNRINWLQVLEPQLETDSDAIIDTEGLLIEIMMLAAKRLIQIKEEQREETLQGNTFSSGTISSATANSGRIWMPEKDTLTHIFFTSDDSNDD